jgi:hypothetical protein
MGSFNENAFMIAGTAIAIFGVGLYIYDTRKDKVVSTYNQYRQPNYNNAASGMNQSQGIMMTGGSRKNNRKKNHKKTNKNR